MQQAISSQGIVVTPTIGLINAERSLTKTNILWLLGKATNFTTQGCFAIDFNAQ